MNGAVPFLTLPPRAHLPGRTPRPDEDFFDSLKADLSPDLNPAALAASPAFQGGVDAIRQRYYWEAHELLEAVWMCLPPASAERHVLQGLIHLANAGLKARMAKADAVLRILMRADASLAEAFLHGHADVMGLSAADLTTLRRQIIAERPDPK